MYINQNGQRKQIVYKPTVEGFRGVEGFQVDRKHMFYIGTGVLVVILLIVLAVYLHKRKSAGY